MGLYLILFLVRVVSSCLQEGLMLHVLMWLNHSHRDKSCALFVVSTGCLARVGEGVKFQEYKNAS